MSRTISPHFQALLVNPAVTIEQRGWLIELVGALDHYADLGWHEDSDERGTRARQALYGEDA